MEVLNAAGVTPFSSLQKHDRKPEPRRLFLPKSPNFRTEIQKTFDGSLAVLSSFLTGSGLARAATYDEALAQSAGDGGGGGPGVDVGGFVDGILRLGTENPLVVGGGAVALAVLLILGREPQKFGVETARSAYARLGDGGALLLDIREGKEFKKSGSPDLRGIKKKAVSIAYRGDDKPGFLKKLALKFKDPENTTLFILDK